MGVLGDVGKVFGSVTSAAGNVVEGVVDKVDDVGRAVGLGAVTDPLADLVDEKIDGLEDRLDPAEARDYPALGFDPAPGTTATVESLAQSLGEVATRLGDAEHALLRVGQSGSIWQGQGADAFRNKLGELPRYLDTANRSLGQAAHALGGWGTDLASMQTTARGYEKEAEAARRALNEAKDNPDLQLAGRTFPAAQLAQAQSRLDEAEQQVKKAAQDLKDIIEQAKRLRNQHRDLAEQVAKALRNAAEQAPETTIFDHIADEMKALEKGIEDLAKQTWKFIQEHSHTIAAISDVFADMSGILGVAALATSWVPGVGEVLGGASLACSAVALAGHVVARAAGDDKVSWTTIGLDAFGSVPFGTFAGDALKASHTLGIESETGLRVLKGSEALEASAPEVVKAVKAEALTTDRIVSGGTLMTSLATPYFANQHGLQRTAPLADDLRDYWVPNRMNIGDAISAQVRDGIEKDRK